MLICINLECKSTEHRTIPTITSKLSIPSLTHARTLVRAGEELEPTTVPVRFFIRHTNLHSHSHCIALLQHTAACVCSDLRARVTSHDCDAVYLAIHHCSVNKHITEQRFGLHHFLHAFSALRVNCARPLIAECTPKFTSQRFEIQIYG